MRRRWEALILIVAVALGAVGVLATPASAQTTGVFSCSYTVSPTTLPATGGVVTISGVAPGSTVVRVFINGVFVASTVSAPVTGFFSVDVEITASVTVAVALDDYPTTPCIGVGGEAVDRNSNGIVVGGASATRNLAYTGSSETRPVVLIGVSALCLGLVLLVAARRRVSVHGRE